MNINHTQHKGSMGSTQAEMDQLKKDIDAERKKALERTAAETNAGEDGNLSQWFLLRIWGFRL